MEAKMPDLGQTIQKGGKTPDSRSSSWGGKRKKKTGKGGWRRKIVENLRGKDKFSRREGHQHIRTKKIYFSNRRFP